MLGEGINQCGSDGCRQQDKNMKLGTGGSTIHVSRTFPRKKNARIDFALQDIEMSHSSATEMNQTYGVQSAAQSFLNLEAFEIIFSNINIITGGLYHLNYPTERAVALGRRTFEGRLILYLTLDLREAGLKPRRLYGRRLPGKPMERNLAH